MNDAVTIISGLIAIVMGIFALLKCLKSFQERALFIIIFLFSIFALKLMMLTNGILELGFITIAFTISTLSFWIICFWLPHILITHLKNTSEDKNIATIINIILHGVLFLVSYVGMYGLMYLVLKVLS